MPFLHSKLFKMSHIDSLRADFSRYGPNISFPIPISEDFGRGRVIMVKGVLGEASLGQRPVFSILDSDLQGVFQVKIDPSFSLVYLTSSTKVRILNP